MDTDRDDPLDEKKELIDLINQEILNKDLENKKLRTKQLKSFNGQPNRGYDL
jgi:hypothetical protein